MTASIDPVELARELIRCPSVTPARGQVFDVLERMLEPLGFTVHRFVLGEPPDGPTENMVAFRGEGSPHFGFAGHLDVVPPGEGWDCDPFDPRKSRTGVLIGRGANDMKSAIGAFVAAVARASQARGTLSFLITGDEEGYSTFGTPRIIDWLIERKIRPDMILIGEPTSVDRLGDTVKIGRRGSVNMWIEVPGLQGHVAYPHRTENPVPPLARIIAALAELHLDDGTEAFPPSNLEFTGIDDPDARQQRHPGSATAQLNIRFNDLHKGADLVRTVEEIAAREAPGASSPGAHIGRGVPHSAWPALRCRRRGDPRGNRGGAGAVDQRRDVRRPVPDPAMPGGRFRASQRDDAQGRRNSRAYRYPGAVADLPTNYREGRRLGDRLGLAVCVAHQGAKFLLRHRSPNAKP
jgi:succinyl-diaminopimelate desuccinylase